MYRIYPVELIIWHLFYIYKTLSQVKIYLHLSHGSNKDIEHIFYYSSSPASMLHFFLSLAIIFPAIIHQMGNVKVPIDGFPFSSHHYSSCGYFNKIKWSHLIHCKNNGRDFLTTFNSKMDIIKSCRNLWAGEVPTINPVCLQRPSDCIVYHLIFFFQLYTSGVYICCLW